MFFSTGLFKMVYATPRLIPSLTHLVCARTLSQAHIISVPNPTGIVAFATRASATVV